MNITKEYNGQNEYDFSLFRIEEQKKISSDMTLLQAINKICYLSKKHNHELVKITISQRRNFTVDEKKHLLYWLNNRGFICVRENRSRANKLVYLTGNRHCEKLAYLNADEPTVALKTETTSHHELSYKFVMRPNLKLINSSNTTEPNFIKVKMKIKYQKD